MTFRKILAALFLAVLGVTVASSAMARPRVGIHFGFGYPYPYYGGYYHPYYPPYGYGYRYYAPPVVVAPPVTYIEQGQAAPQAAPAPAPQAAPVEQPATNYWYFCRESNAYYPYVQSCASEWQRVTPTPPTGAR